MLPKMHLNNHEFLQVGAALDLTHTQNIGKMIKAHFPQSQVSCSSEFIFSLFWCARQVPDG
jgi:hypothetical protein